MSMTATQLAQHLHVHTSTIIRAASRAGLSHARNATYDDEQQALIQARLRANGKAQSKKMQPSAHTACNVQEEVAQLKLQVAQLQAQLRTQGEVLDTVLGWGRNAAKIIRTMWQRLPDYRAGDTPGEFPAVKHLGRKSAYSERQQRWRSRD